MLINNSKTKKRICYLVDFAFPTDHRVKIKESENIQILESCQRVVKVLKHEGVEDTNFSWSIWNRPSGLVKRLKEFENRRRIENIQTAALLENSKEFRKSKKNCCHSDPSERPPFKIDMKNSQ